MQNRKEVLIIDNDLDFVSKIGKSLENKINIISAENVETALTYWQFNKKSEEVIAPDLIIIGDGCKVSTNLKKKLKEDFPKIYNEKTLHTFLPLFYCELFQNAFQTDPKIKPKACICADLKQYPLNGDDQDITRKLGYCMQHDIPLMDKNEENRKLILTMLKEHICKKCGIRNDKIYR